MYCNWLDVELKTTKEDGVFTTLQDFYYPISKRKAILIKAGFLTDCASIPHILWGILDPTDISYRLAAVLHDALYAVHLFDRAKCDELFLAAMKLEGCGWFKRYTVWSHVRAYGWAAWDAKAVETMAYNLAFVSIVDIN